MIKMDDLFGEKFKRKTLTTLKSWCYPQLIAQLTVNYFMVFSCPVYKFRLEIKF